MCSIPYTCMYLYAVCIVLVDNSKFTDGSLGDGPYTSVMKEVGIRPLWLDSPS